MTNKSERLRNCAAVQCTRLVERHRLMCWHHWNMVPGNLQNRVYRTFRALTNAQSPRRFAARRPYLEAVQAAIASLPPDPIPAAPIQGLQASLFVMDECSALAFTQPKEIDR